LSFTIRRPDLDDQVASPSDAAGAETFLSAANMSAMPFRSAGHPQQFGGATQRFGGSLSEQLFVRTGKPSKFVEPVIGGDARHGCLLRVASTEGSSHVVQPVSEHALLRAHASDIVKGVAETPLAQSDDATEPGNGNGCTWLCAITSLSQLDCFETRDSASGLPAQSGVHGRLRYRRHHLLKTGRCNSCYR